MTESGLHLEIEPVPRDDGTLAFDLEDASIVLRRAGSGWDVEGLVGEPTVHLPGHPRPPVRLAVRLADDEAVARFAAPLFLAPGASSDVWIEWPLEVALLVDGAELGCVRAGRRRTLFGTVNDGRILPAAICAPVPTPDAERLRDRPVAALQVRVENRGSAPARVARVPVIGGMLALHRRRRTLASTRVDVVLHDGGSAEATSVPGAPPTGFERVADARNPGAHKGHLGWLLDATRRSVEYPL